MSNQQKKSNGNAPSLNNKQQGKGRTAVEPQKKRTRLSIPHTEQATGEFTQRSENTTTQLFNNKPSSLFGSSQGNPEAQSAGRAFQTTHSSTTSSAKQSQSKPDTSAKPIPFSLTGIRNHGMTIQTSMVVTAANDVYEQEADQIAAQVVQRINSPSVQLARDEAEFSPSPLGAEIERFVQRAVNVGYEGGNVSRDLESSINQARPSGKPFSGEVRRKFEGAFGADFSQVRIHTNGRSDQINRSINAKAFTTGHDIFFSQGSYNPHTSQGQHLIAHELTHVMQQNGPAVQRKWMAGNKRPSSSRKH